MSHAAERRFISRGGSLYAQLILENARIYAVDAGLVDQIFDVLVRDFSRHAVELHGRRASNELHTIFEVIEHPHLLTRQVAFTVTGSRRKLDEFAEGLRAEELATMRTEREVMLSPL